MAISLKHAFTSAKGDPADATLVRPSNWNAEHNLTLATDKLVGRQTAGTGAAEEITCTAFARALLAAVDLDDFMSIIGAGKFSTGDIKPTLKTAADAGWVLCDDGTIGSASSGASSRANADCENLFTLLWNNISDTWAPVVGGRGASAAADWAANKKITLTKMLGRALGAAGAGSGLTSRALGENLGEETHQLTTAELAAHTHTFTGDAMAPHSHTGKNNEASVNAVGSGSGGGTKNYTTDGPTSSDSAGTPTGTNSSTGGDTAHNNMQPTSFVNFMVKL